MVIKEIIENIGKQSFIKKLKRINRYTPAVTNVDECTRDETGVGAAIAAGNHDEKGTCALFVTHPNIKIKLNPRVVENEINSNVVHPQ